MDEVGLDVGRKGSEPGRGVAGAELRRDLARDSSGVGESLCDEGRWESGLEDLEERDPVILVSDLYMTTCTGRNILVDRGGRAGAGESAADAAASGSGGTGARAGAGAALRESSGREDGHSKSLVLHFEACRLGVEIEYYTGSARKDRE